MAELNEALNINELEENGNNFWTASESLLIAPEKTDQIVKDGVYRGEPTSDQICYLIGKYQCRREDERISGREKKIYVDVLEDLQRLLETAMQEGLQS